MHFYDENGNSCHEVENKSRPGQMRPSTIRDAKNNGWNPSITTIMSCAASPGLTEYKITQAIEAALLNPNQALYSIKKLAQKSSTEAAMEGNIIHDFMEQYLKWDGMLVSTDRDCDRFIVRGNIVKEAWQSIHERFPDVKWISEKSFSRDNMAGRVDLHSERDHGIVIDFKTKGTTDKKKMEGYDTHLMQLAAYRIGLGMPHASCYNLFISTVEPGILVWKEWSHEELNRGYKMFQALKEYFYLSNNWEK